MPSLFFEYGDFDNFPYKNAYITITGPSKRDIIEYFKEQWPGKDENTLFCTRVHADENYLKSTYGGPLDVFEVDDDDFDINQYQTTKGHMMQDECELFLSNIDEDTKDTFFKLLLNKQVRKDVERRISEDYASENFTESQKKILIGSIAWDFTSCHEFDQNESYAYQIDNIIRKRVEKEKNS